MSTNHFDSHTTAKEVADAFASEIAGKNVLITGTSIGGIGFEVARVIAQYANLVIITGYDSGRLQLSVDAIKKEFPQANIRKLILNVSSLAAVPKAAAEVNAYPEPLHILINNAAATPAKFSVTEDGLERQMATNHVGPFLFTNLILPKIIASRTDTVTPRVIFIASDAHAFTPGLDISTLAQPMPEKYKTAFEPYNDTKSANVLTTVELANRLKGKVNAYTLHPGLIFSQIMTKPESLADYQEYNILDKDGQPNKDLPFEWKSVPEGAATTVVAAFDPALSDKSGAYLRDCQVTTDDVAPHSTDPERASQLWKATEKIVGQSFDF
ncbi:NAD-P-binding protein [Roridomyces roridus]|uniref:NAD-P-binding protein n=1 Tax=Roridomyces roridus TaxID=1738132 RepID=A0AAD7FZ07_9AGAR|nr:NAD-P-binding protein [Roridomyces roridus]